MVDGTLKINSGMISSAYWTVGNTSSATTQIWGGALDFNGKEAIINNQNAFYNLTAGVISGGDFNLASAITNATGLTKTGFQRVNILGANTYTGLTTVTEGVLDIRNSKGLGVGGLGNGVVVTGNGELRTNSGIRVGTAAAREDIYVGIHSFEGAQVMRVEADLTQWFSNVTIDNVDASGQPIFTPRIRTDNSATSIIMGDIAGGDTLISNDVLAIDSRVVQFDTAGNNVFILRGVIGDRYVGGVAAPIADPISFLPTLAGTRTNENEVLRVTLAGGSLESNFILDRQYNAAGRLRVAQGILLINYTPGAPGSDGTGFWTDTALSKIPNADSSTTAFNINGQTSHQGFSLETGGLFMTKAGQVFNMASFSTSSNAVKYFGGINETGTVTFGDGTGTLTLGGNVVAQLYAADGGTVVFNQRMIGNPATFGYVKNGRGTVELLNSTAGAGDSQFVIAGGTLVFRHSGATPAALTADQNVRFDGGTFIAIASSDGNTTTNLATNNAASRVVNYLIGGTEIVARTSNTGTARNMTINMGNATAGNFTRALGATGNLVEDSSAGGTASITLNFEATTTAAAKDAIIPWLTYGTQSRTATDFARVISASGNAIDSFTGLRAVGDFNNNVATWTANGNISENGGFGFSGTLAGPLTLSSLRFDSHTASIVDLGTNVLTIAAPALATSAGAILVSSNGSFDKTITGGAGSGLTSTGGTTELILHHYGTGNLNINVPITGAIDLTIAGPSSTNAATIGTTGTVVLNGANTYNGQTFINGAALSFTTAAQLGTNPGASDVARIRMNGGTLRYSGTGIVSLENRGITFDGGGGTIDVAEGGAELLIADDIASNAQFRGDLIKVGAGTLTLKAGTDSASAAFLGLADIRQGTLRLVAPNIDSGTRNADHLGVNNSYMDGTIFRTGANFALQLGNLNDSGDWNINEWFTFEGNNYVSVGTINADTGNIQSSGFPDPGPIRPVNFNGVNTINGTVTFDVVPGGFFRLNNGGNLYTTGSGTIIKDGQGSMQIGSNIPDFTGAITILQGRLYASGQADNLGTGYTVANGSKVITLGSADRQGIAELAPNSDNVAGATFELNHNINVVYNPAQSKRLLVETFANGSQIELNGNFTLNDNLQVYINDAAETGGSTNYVNFNGKLLDGATTSGNLVFTSDDTNNANDNSNGRVNNYLVLRNDNSGWTGDVRVSIHTGFDQDENAILRLEAGNALGVANDVDMGFNSILQVGGSGTSGIVGATSGNRTIGSLSTNGGTGPFIGGTAGGTMGASTNGVSVIIENAATTVGTLVITQSTPASTEVVWNAHFRDGTLNSEFFAPGATPVASAALNIVKAGDGWATLQTDNAHTGTTTVTGGILQVGRGGVGDTGISTVQPLSIPQFTSNTGTTVAGTGQIQGDSTILGNLKPGDEAGGSMGTLYFTAAVNLGASSVTTLQAQRASYTAMNVLGMHDALYSTWNAGHTTDAIYSHLLNDPVTTMQHDQIRIAGQLTVTAGGKIVVANNGYNPTAGDVFNLIDWTGSGLSLNLGGIAYNGGLFRTGAETGTDLELFQLGYGLVYDVSQFNTTGNILVVQASSRQVYWNGDQDASWSTNNSGNTNWLDGPAGSDLAGVPTFTDDVYFTATSAANFATSLGSNFALNKLFLGVGANAATGASINTGSSTLTLYGGINQASGSAANTISGTGGVVLAQDQTWTNSSTSNALTVSAPVSGAAALTKAGDGTMILSGTNTYSGATTVSAGTLQLGDGGSSGSLSTSSDITVATGATFAVNQNDNVTQGIDFRGAAITGAGSLAQNGSGTTILTAANSYTGTTTVNAGTLQLGNGGTTGSLATASVISVGSGATFAVNQSDTVTQGTDFGAAAITGAGSFAQTGGGTTILTADNSYTGTTTISTGTLQVGDGGTTGAIGTTGVITNNAALVVNRSNDFSTSQQITGVGSFQQAGSGATTLSASNNNYTGATTVINGELRVNGLSGTSSVTVGEAAGTLANAATLSATGAIAGAITVGSYDSGTSTVTSVGILAPGATSANADIGTLTISAANTALTVATGSQIQLGITAATISNATNYALGVFSYNGTDYDNAKLYFDAIKADAPANDIWTSAKPSTQHDFIDLTGASSTLSVGARALANTSWGQGSIVVNATSLGAVQVGQVFNLLDWAGASLSGGFSVGSALNGRYDASSNVIAGDLDLAGLGAGLGWDVSAFTTYGILVVVPEPSRTLLLMFGLFSLFFRRRRRVGSV
jgi:autotransporter-associated beta strand protein